MWQATYSLKENVFRTDIVAEAEKPSPIMLSSHVYWNLDGYLGSGTVLDHELMIRAGRYLETDGILVSVVPLHHEKLELADSESVCHQVPTGKVISIAEGSVMDFQQARTIESRFEGTQGMCGPSEKSLSSILHVGG